MEVETAPLAARRAEKLLEKIAEAGAPELKLEIAGRIRAAAGAPGMPLPTRRRAKLGALFPIRAQFVIFLALSGVAEDLVSLVDFLEFLFGGLFVFGDVGMVLPGELAKGFANLLVARRSSDAQCLVIILKLDCHKLSRRPPAAARGCGQRPQFT